MAQTVEGIAKQLAHGDKKIRDSAMAAVPSLLRKLKHPIPELDLLKLWHAVFYCYWMSDKVRIQHELAAEIAKLFHVMTDSLEMLRLLKAFFDTMAREWCGIDHLRLDKYLTLVRKVVREMFVYFKTHPKIDIDDDHVEVLTGAFVFLKRPPNGLRYHILDVLYDELVAGYPEIDTDTLQMVLLPFYDILMSCDDKKMFQQTVEKVNLRTLSQDVFILASNPETQSGHRKPLYTLHRRYTDICNRMYGPEEDEEEDEDGVEETVPAVEDGKAEDGAVAAPDADDESDDGDDDDDDDGESEDDGEGNDVPVDTDWVILRDDEVMMRDDVDNSDDDGEEDDEDDWDTEEAGGENDDDDDDDDESDIESIDEEDVVSFKTTPGTGNKKKQQMVITPASSKGKKQGTPAKSSVKQTPQAKQPASNTKQHQNSQKKSAKKSTEKTEADVPTTPVKVTAEPSTPVKSTGKGKAQSQSQHKAASTPSPKKGKTGDEAVNVTPTGGAGSDSVKKRRNSLDNSKDNNNTHQAHANAIPPVTPSKRVRIELANSTAIDYPLSVQRLKKSKPTKKLTENVKPTKSLLKTPVKTAK